MFNIGTPELLVVLVIAMVVVGPERLPELARWVGRGLRELRKVQDDVKDMVQTGMGDDFRDAANEVKGAMTEMRKTASEVKRAAGITAATSAQPHVARPLTPASADRDPDETAPAPDPSMTGAPVEDAPAVETEPGTSAAE